MKPPGLSILLLFCPLLRIIASEYPLNPAHVEYELKSLANWQLAHPSSVALRDWQMAPFYEGLIRLSESSGDPRYIAEVMRFGEMVAWHPGSRVYDAEDQAVSHSWLRVFSHYTEQPRYMLPAKERMDSILQHAATEGWAMGQGQKSVPAPVRWTRSEALYLAPPVWGMLFALTGKAEYIRFLDQEYRYAFERLWDEEAQLFYGDEGSRGRKTTNGAKAFRGSGNGWVYAGLALLLETLPESHASRDWYVGLYLEMTRGVLQAQQGDGLWRPSLHDPAEIPVGESSASGFFCFGLAWGVRHGLLDAELTMPYIESAWRGLQTRIQTSGKLGYVESVSASAGPSISADTSFVYGVGAVLMAGSELLLLLQGDTNGVDREKVYLAARMLYEEDTEAQAFACYEPRRRDDFAWENDRMAFRAYGPSLNNGSVDSGVDVWLKRVPYPIVRKWYSEEFNDTGNYHVDVGEGFDNYSVGTSRGLGGTGIWADGELLTPGVYKEFKVEFTTREAVVFRLYYEYENGIREVKTYRLGLSDDYCAVTSSFSDINKSKPLKDLTVAVGLVAQDENSRFVTSLSSKQMTVHEQYPEDIMRLHVLIESDTELTGFARVEVEGKYSEQLAVLKTNHLGEIYYRIGYDFMPEN